MKTLFPNSLVKFFFTAIINFQSKYILLEKVILICQLLPLKQNLGLDIHIKNIYANKVQSICKGRTG